MHLIAAARVLLLSLSALLASGPGGRAATAVPVPPQVDGAALARELGCAGCHSGVGTADLIRSRAPALGPDAPPLPASFVFGYLADPQPRRKDIGASRMPDFRLDEGERLALALLLGTPDGDPAVADARTRHPGVDARTGRRLFDALGCAGCHAGVTGAEQAVAPDLSREGARARPVWLAGYLATPQPIRGDGHPTLGGARMPDFRLTADETAALATYLGRLGRNFASPEDGTPTAVESRRAQRLLEDRLACRGCHVIDGRGGRIGPSLDGVSARRTPAYLLEMVLDPGRAAPGAPMPHQPLPPREASRVARYLLDIPGEGSAPQRRSLIDPDHPAWAASASQPGDDGAQLYARHCAACHGDEGAGDGWNAPNLPVPPVAHADAALMGRRADDTLYDGISAGAWVLDGSPLMPAFGSLLDPTQIRSLVAYIRTLCACTGPTWSSDGRGVGGSAR